MTLTIGLLLLAAQGSGLPDSAAHLGLHRYDEGSDAPLETRHVPGRFAWSFVPAKASDGSAYAFAPLHPGDTDWSQTNIASGLREQSELAPLWSDEEWPGTWTKALVVSPEVIELRSAPDSLFVEGTVHVSLAQHASVAGGELSVGLPCSCELTAPPPTLERGAAGASIGIRCDERMLLNPGGLSVVFDLPGVPPESALFGQNPRVAAPFRVSPAHVIASPGGSFELEIVGRESLSQPLELLETSASECGLSVIDQSERSIKIAANLGSGYRYDTIVLVVEANGQPYEVGVVVSPPVPLLDRQGRRHLFAPCIPGETLMVGNRSGTDTWVVYAADRIGPLPLPDVLEIAGTVAVPSDLLPGECVSLEVGEAVLNLRADARISEFLPAWSEAR